MEKITSLPSDCVPMKRNDGYHSAEIIAGMGRELVWTWHYLSARPGDIFLGIRATTGGHRIGVWKVREENIDGGLDSPHRSLSVEKTGDGFYRVCGLATGEPRTSLREAVFDLFDMSLLMGVSRKYIAEERGRFEKACHDMNEILATGRILAEGCVLKERYISEDGLAMTINPVGRLYRWGGRHVPGFCGDLQVVAGSAANYRIIPRRGGRWRGCAIGRSSEEESFIYGKLDAVYRRVLKRIAKSLNESASGHHKLSFRLFMRSEIERMAQEKIFLEPLRYWRRDETKIIYTDLPHQ